MHKKWTRGLTWSDTELDAITRGQGSEAYDYTYGVYPIPKSFRVEAKKELKERKIKRGKR
jgi:hypothetical protein